MDAKRKTMDTLANTEFMVLVHLLYGKHKGKAEAKSLVDRIEMRLKESNALIDKRAQQKIAELKELVAS